MRAGRALGVVAVAAVALGGAYVALDREDIVLDEAQRAEWGGTYQRLSDGVTHYRLDGPVDGPLVVLVHGGTIPIWTWDAQVPALTGAGYRVLTYDAFGRGYSDRPDVSYGRALYAGQLGELLDSLGLADPFHLVGLSQGGGTVVTFTADHPERVRSLTLIAPVVFDYSVNPVLRVPLLGEVVARTVGVRMLVERFAPMVEAHPRRDAYTRLYTEQTRVEGFQRAILSMIRGDALRDFRTEYRRVGELSMPRMLIWGADDEEITREMVDTAGTLVPDLEVHTVPDAGHGVVFERQDEVNRLLLEFLDRAEGDPIAASVQIPGPVPLQ